MKRQGFSLVELLIVIAILAILTTIMAMTINPIAMMQRATDARMKKDLSRIRVAFEEYRSDKKHFPDDSEPDRLLSKLMTKANCGTDVFAPWLASWPCDPRGNPYQILVSSNPSWQWFKVLTKLDNKKDDDIPEEIKRKEVAIGRILPYNYGVSSTNVMWYDTAGCALEYGKDKITGEIVQQCYGGTPCGHIGSGCSGGSCYVDGKCSALCQVDCCGNGCTN